MKTMSDLTNSPQFNEAVEAGAEAAFEAARPVMGFPTGFAGAPAPLQDTYRRMAEAALTAGLAKLGI